MKLRQALAAGVAVAAAGVLYGARRHLRAVPGHPPRRHPERVPCGWLAPLRAAQEAELARIRDELWPDGRWTDVIEELRREQGWPQ